MSQIRSHSEIHSLGQPQADEQVLWEGRPDMQTLARTAFHTRAVSVYFLLLIVTAVALGSIGGAVLTAFAGLVSLGLLFSFAWLATRTTRYVLTDRRLILNIGMAIEKSVNLPLRMVGAAHMTDRGADMGDIALELVEGRGLGYAMLWPHARPFQFSKPQPMLRAIPDVSSVAAMLAKATAAHREIAMAGPPAVQDESAPLGGMTEALA